MVLEDIDCMRHDLSREGSGSRTAGAHGPSLSDVLNFLDGVNSRHGQIVIMTTNNPARLDRALLRHGRCDFQLETTPCSEETVRKMFRIFFDTSPALPKGCKYGKVSPAEVINLMTAHRDDCLRASQLVSDLLMK